MQTRACIAAVLALTLLTSACSQNEVVTDLELAVNAVEVALPLIGPSVGLPANVSSQIQTYLGLTSQAIGKASDILAGSGTDVQKAAAVAAAFAGIAVPAVPSQYQGIASAVQQVTALVTKFLADTSPAVGTPGIAWYAPSYVTFDPSGRAFFEAVKKKSTKITAKDRKRLAEIKRKAEEAARKAAKRSLDPGTP
jgi:hypothetical protein